MDLVEYSQNVFNNIVIDYNEVAGQLGLQDVTYIPISALDGDNIVDRSTRITWYSGKTLLEFLEEVEIENDIRLSSVELPHSFIHKPHCSHAKSFSNSNKQNFRTIKINMTKRVIIVGIPGVGKSTVLTSVQNLLSQRGVDTKIAEFGKIMFDQARIMSIHNRDQLRRLSIDQQRTLQEMAANSILVSFVLQP